MKLLFSIKICIVFIAFVTISCNKKQDKSGITTLRDLYPLAVGKTFTYRLDSTLPSASTISLEVHSYLAKDSVESSFKDLTGRTSYRIFRYLNDTLQKGNWRYVATYNAVFDTTRVEYVDNNLRFIPIAVPINESTVWLGNKYINTDSASPVGYLANWEYQYQNIGQAYNVLKGSIPTTYTILQQDEMNPSVPFDPSLSYQDKNYSIEVYGKGIGLIYKEFLHYIWQGDSGGNGFFQEAVGIKLNLVDYK